MYTKNEFAVLVLLLKNDVLIHSGFSEWIELTFETERNVVSLLSNSKVCFIIGVACDCRNRFDYANSQFGYVCELICIRAIVHMNTF